MRDERGPVSRTRRGLRWAAIACASFSTAATPDSVTPSDTTLPDGPSTVRVAAIQYGGDPSHVDAPCDRADAVCGLAALMREAAGAGATLVVAPEYALGGVEPDPPVGEVIERGQLGVLSATAAELEIFVVANLLTKGADESRHNTLVAFGPDGVVVAKHHKIELFAGERDHLRSGEDITVFDTPFGKVALLICADIYADPVFHERILAAGANIVAVASQWTVARATRWQAAFARDWGVFVVAANSSTDSGRGGGVFGPSGERLAVGHAGDNAIVMADLEL